MRTKVIGLLLFVTMVAFAQQNVKDLTAKQIPANMKYKGELVSCVSYTDSLGENYIIQTQTALLTPQSAVDAGKKFELVNTKGKIDTIRNIEADYRIKGLFVYHYVQKKDSVSLLWKNLDNVKECSYKYLKADYLTKPIISDLDNNGIAEVWLVYELGCRKDDSVGLGMKLMMYTGKDSYGMRGIRQVKVAKEGEPETNTMKADDSFEKQPQAVRDYALALWNKYKVEK